MPNSTIINFIKTTWIYNDKKIFLTHLWVWVAFFSIDYIFILAIRGTNQIFSEYFWNAVFLCIFFYVTVYFLLKTNIKTEPLKAILTYIIIIFFAILFKNIYDKYIIIDVVSIETLKTNPFSYYSLELWRFCTFTFYAIAYITYLNSLQNQQIIQDTEKKLLLTEIAFLKAQINPHFLFNTLNFVFEDVSSISPKSGDIILQLADMMRYSVQSTKLDFSPITKEVDAIDRYIYLQRKRFGERMYIEFYKQGNLAQTEIPPLIMLSIVENAFKYGIIYDPENPIEIYLEVTQEYVLFSCKNAIRPNYKEVETNAVGIKNIRRRLEISYKDKFELENWTENKNYFVHLKVFSRKVLINT